VNLGSSVNLKKFLAFQIILVLAGTVIALFLGFENALSYLLGGVLMLLANTLMLSRFFMRNRVFSSTKELMFLYAGEVLKLVVVALGTVFVVIYIKPLFLWYFLGLIVLQIAMWMMPFFLNKLG
jgi:F0F1-type ATP synthase assembly protein I